MKLHPFLHNPEADFETNALALFRMQATHCELYRNYLQTLGRDPAAIRRLEEVPFLPIEFFKTHRVVTGDGEPEMVFSSSGTTGVQQSQHEVLKLSVYEHSFRTAFAQFYGPPEDLAILALLPSYQEREGSSLIYMVDDLIAKSNHPESGYFLYDHQALHQTLERLKAEKHPTLLIGVTYALLDFSERYTLRDFEQLIVMETGGMKGRRREMIREEVHQQLCQSFGLSSIHSEYGMTELLSQAYSKGGGKFRCPPWMRVYARDTNDPFSYVETGRTGGLNVIDLANVHSCAFLATQDLGRVFADGSFEVLGRFDHSDIRGCNLLVP